MSFMMQVVYSASRMLLFVILHITVGLPCLAHIYLSSACFWFFGRSRCIFLEDWTVNSSTNAFNVGDDHAVHGI